MRGPIVSYATVEQEYIRIAARWTDKPIVFPIPRTRTDTGSEHLEIDEDGKMSLINTERGSEFGRRSTYSLDELMYWIFESIAFWKAVQYELENRHPIQDGRIIIFAKQIEFMNALSPIWAKRCEAEHTKILGENPYMDVPPELRKNV